MCHQPKSYCNAMCRHSLRQRFESFTLRLFALLLPRTFEAAATVPVSSLPTDGKPDKRNWHLRSLKDRQLDRKSTRLNSSHVAISYAVFCLKKKKRIKKHTCVIIDII